MTFPISSLSKRFEDLYKTAYVTDIICQQDFSDKSGNSEKKMPTIWNVLPFFKKNTECKK